MHENTIIPKVKICCIRNVEESNLAIKYGANAIGLVGPMPSGPGMIDNKMIKDIGSQTPSKISTFLLTSEVTAEGIINHHNKVSTSTIQMVDRVDIEVYEKLKIKLPNVDLVQVVHVLDEKSIEEAITVSKYVDYLLLDSGNPNKKIKEFGGTGRVHDWSLSKQIVKLSKIPVFLSGGLNPNNIKKAILQVKPYGVDLCTGVRTNSKLDEVKLKMFFEEINSLKH